jgi:hypothetical protein
VKGHSGQKDTQLQTSTSGAKQAQGHCLTPNPASAWHLEAQTLGISLEALSSPRSRTSAAETVAQAVLILSGQINKPFNWPLSKALPLVFVSRQISGITLVSVLYSYQKRKSRQISAILAHFLCSSFISFKELYLFVQFIIPTLHPKLTWIFGTFLLWHTENEKSWFCWVL